MMKTTYNWLREYIDLDETPQQVAEMLTLSGLEVEQVEDLGDDWLLVAEVTSNRPDLLGVIGIARELSALTGRPVKLPAADSRQTGDPAQQVASVRVDAPELCPRYTARIVRHVQVGPSPEWLASRLEAIGLRPVNNVVDITNWVLFECCQPLHAFDLDRLREGAVIVRRARVGEQLVAIDGSAHKLKPDHLVIADAERPVALAGVMGGLDTEISASTATVLIESAQFDPANNRATSRDVGLASDSSYRFERGVDPVNVEWASRRCVHLLQELCGGQVAPGVIDVWQGPPSVPAVALRVARMNKLLGVDIPADRAASILSALGMDIVSQDADTIEARPPSWRADLSREVDLIEEVARIRGLDHIPMGTALRISAGRESRAERAVRAVHDTLVGCGHFEVLTSSFQDEAASRRVSPWTDAEPLTFNNVVRQDENRLRVSVLTGLLSVKRTNAARGVACPRIFEITRVYLPVPGAKLPDERSVVAILGERDMLQIKGVVEAVMDTLRVEGATFEPLDGPFFDSAMSAQATLVGQRVGVLGRVSRATAEAYDLPKAPFVAELDLDKLIDLARLDVAYQRVPTYPGSERDLAIIVDESVTWAQIEGCVQALDIPILESLRFFDIYRGKPVPKGRKSVAFRMALRASDRTLSGEEIETECDRTVQALKDDLGADLRA